MKKMLRDWLLTVGVYALKNTSKYTVLYMKKPIPYISKDNFSQEDIFDYWNDHLPGHVHVNRTYPDVVRMWRRFHGCPGCGGGIERVFTAAGKTS
jgi:hypothetical protein